MDNNFNNGGFDNNAADNNVSFDNMNAQPQNAGQYQYADNNANVYQPVQSSQDAPKGKAIASLVLGIVSLLSGCCCTYLGIILGIISIVMACLYKKSNNGKMGGMATAGMICSILSIVICVVCIALVFAGLVDTTWLTDALQDQLG